LFSYAIGLTETHVTISSQCAGTYNDYWHCSDKCVSFPPPPPLPIPALVLVNLRIII
jgi:hypothetical protein